eukprot:scaffold70574_cov47-Attheya_sp.AAC.1
MDVPSLTSRDWTMLLPMHFPMYRRICYFELDDLKMLDCFLTYPIVNDEDPQEYPLDYQTIQHYQQNDERLQAANE